MGDIWAVLKNFFTHGLQGASDSPIPELANIEMARAAATRRRTRRAARLVRTKFTPPPRKPAVSAPGSPSLLRAASTANGQVGEGDERWIVKEREDGTNVNGWHWKETNLTGWSQSRLKELLGPVVAFEDGTGYAKVTEVEKIEGDVTVQSRKQKKFPLYELEITLKWEGELYDDQGKVKASAKGRVKIPDLSEETYDDLEMTVAVEEETDAKRPLKEAMRKAGSAKVREACMAFVKELKETVNSGQDALKVKVAPPTERANASYVVAAAEKSKLASIKIKYEFSLLPVRTTFSTPTASAARRRATPRS